MNKSLVGVIISLVFLLATVGGFFWLWTTTNTGEATSTASASSNYAIVDITSVKKEAVDIMTNLEKASDIPLGTPSEKMGKKTNPFVK